MANEGVNVSDSTARVAIELMYHINIREKPKQDVESERRYWLTLFSQCQKAAAGNHSLESILKEK